MAHFSSALAAAALGLALFGATGPADSASFDCGKRDLAPMEKAICEDSGLSELDEHLSRYYAGSLAALEKGAAPCLRADQLAWLATERNQCSDERCLRKVYLARLAELDALQPGMNAVKNIELPRSRRLEWIVPAAADKVAAPPVKTAKPLLVSGQLVDEVATGDGFVLLGEGGERYVVNLLMFLEPATTERLQLLARARATFTGRGFASADGKSFEPSRCVFVYREP